MTESSDFLTAITASAPEDQWGYLWTLDGSGARHTEWFPLGDLDGVAEWAATHAEDRDVYFGAGTSNTKRRANQRVGSADAAGIYGLWMDVDIRDADAHKKLNLPPTEADAIELVNLGGLTPTVTVHSGHGLHAWWVFGDFWAFDDEHQRLAAATLAQRWHATLRVRAAERGWIIDSTYDLSRVLRIPGTLNHKSEPPKPVRLIDCEPGRTYEPGDFEEYLVGEAEMRSMSLPVTRTYVTDEVKVNPEAEPPWEKVEALRVNEPRFAAALDRNRPEFADQSPSSYDLAVATYAAIAEWTDQEIVDLLVATRRRQGENLKLDNQQYYRRTVARAHEGLHREKASQEIAEHVAEMVESAPMADDEEKTDARRKLFDMVSSLLSLEVTNMVRYTSDPPEFAVIIGGHQVHLGVVDFLEGQAKFRSRVLASDVATSIPRLKTDQWDQIVQALRHACVDLDIGSEATDVGAMGVWVTEYLLDRNPVSDPVEAAQSQYPFFDETGRICIFPKPFMRWIFTSRGERVEARKVGRVLRQMGATTQDVSLGAHSKTTRQVWVLPKSLAGQSTS